MYQFNGWFVWFITQGKPYGFNKGFFHENDVGASRCNDVYDGYYHYKKFMSQLHFKLKMLPRVQIILFRKEIIARNSHDHCE